MYPFPAENCEKYYVFNSSGGLEKNCIQGLSRVVFGEFSSVTKKDKGKREKTDFAQSNRTSTHKPQLPIRIPVHNTKYNAHLTMGTHSMVMHPTNELPAAETTNTEITQSNNNLTISTTIQDRQQLHHHSISRINHRPGRNPFRQAHDLDLQESYGDSHYDCAPNTIRIFFQNVKGLTYSSTGEDYAYYLACTSTIGAEEIILFYKTAHAFSVHLRVQHNLIAAMNGQTCPRKDTKTRWVEFGTMLKWYLFNRRRLLNYIDEKHSVQEPLPTWWVICAAVACPIV